MFAVYRGREEMSEVIAVLNFWQVAFSLQQSIIIVLSLFTFCSIVVSYKHRQAKVVAVTREFREFRVFLHCPESQQSPVSGGQISNLNFR